MLELIPNESGQDKPPRLLLAENDYSPWSDGAVLVVGPRNVLLAKQFENALLG